MDNHTEATASRFADYLRSHNLRRTAERTTILKRATEIRGHFSADNIVEGLRDGGYRVSPTTVYSTLELLFDAGILLKHRFTGQKCLYEFVNGNEKGHFHLVCSSCGKIREIRDEDLLGRIAAKQYQGFATSHFTLNVYGVCNACARRARRRKDSAPSTRKTTN